MNSFESIGHTQLLAAEGQRQLSAKLAAAMGRLLKRALDRLGRYLPEAKSTPW